MAVYDFVDIVNQKKWSENPWWVEIWIKSEMLRKTIIVKKMTSYSCWYRCVVEFMGNMGCDVYTCADVHIWNA